jgi:hypothetical protein
MTRQEFRPIFQARVDAFPTSRISDSVEGDWFISLTRFKAYRVRAAFRTLEESERFPTLGAAKQRAWKSRKTGSSTCAPPMGFATGSYWGWQEPFSADAEAANPKRGRPSSGSTSEPMADRYRKPHTYRPSHARTSRPSPRAWRWMPGSEHFRQLRKRVRPRPRKWKSRWSSHDAQRPRSQPQRDRDPHHRSRRQPARAIGADRLVAPVAARFWERHVRQRRTAGPPSEHRTSGPKTGRIPRLALPPFPQVGVAGGPGAYRGRPRHATSSRCGSSCQRVAEPRRTRRTLASPVSLTVPGRQHKIAHGQIRNTVLSAFNERPRAPLVTID